MKNGGVCSTKQKPGLNEFRCIYLNKSCSIQVNGLSYLIWLHKKNSQYEGSLTKVQGLYVKPNILVGAFIHP